MKRTILFFALLLFIGSIACSQENTTTEITPIQNEVGNYKLFPTTNMWTFLKLDTRNGRIWQIQWSLESEKRFAYSLSLVRRVEVEEEVANRFTLYSTKNNYNFILLDQISGETWQVQWSLESENRYVVPIY